MGSCFSKEASPPSKAPPQTQSSRVENVKAKEATQPSSAEIKANYSLNSTGNQNNNNSQNNNNNNNNNKPSDLSATSPLSGNVKSFPPNEGPNPNSNGSKANGNTQSNSGNDGRSKTTNGVVANGNGGPSEDTSNRPEVKILLLGSGESGKSTILKQMKIIHQNGYSQEEMLMYKTTVYKNLLDCAKAIVNALEQFNINLEASSASELARPAPATTTKMIDNLDDDEEPHPNDTKVSNDEESSNSENNSNNHNDTSIVAEQEELIIPKITKEELEFIKNSIISPDPDSTLDPELTTIIAKLWSHPAVKNLYATKRSRFYIMDSAPYFFNNVQRIGDVDYIPNVQDILRARIKTTGIYEIRFQMGRLNIHMYDLGGQRSERKKWIHCFDDVTVIIFCVALSEYDQVLLEENTQNRMAESLVLFDSVINSRWFVRTSIVLFLNKIDVFTEKLPVSPLENYFPDYTGGNNIKKAAKYILWRFTQLNRNKLSIYPHITQATDTSNIKLVFAAIKATILQNSLKDSGLI